jgi:dolichyl-diphosphooligosaccharide--protein glycosyltransferase
VLPYGSDALYHLRRILYSCTRFPASLDFDRYLQHPLGARPIWTPTFDWVLALLLRPLGSVEDPSALERAAMWVPPVLGAATVVALYSVARRHFGVGAAWIAAGTLCVLSGHFWYSQVGFLDHHAAVALSSTLLLGAGMTFARDVGAPERGPGPGRELRLGLAMALCLLVWPGSLLHVALAQGACALEVVCCRDRRGAARSARELALAHAVAVLAVLPLAVRSHWPQWGAFSPVVLGGFQPWWLLSGALLCAGAARLWRSERAGRTRARRAASAGLLAVALLASSAALLPGLLEGLGDAWRWLARREAFQARVGESQPLLSGEEGFTLSVAIARLSLFALAFPLVWVVALRAARGRSSAPLRLLLLWSLGLFAATLLQRRFFNSFSVAMALVLGWTGVGVWRSLPFRRASAGLRAAGGALMAVLWVGLLAPSLAPYAVHLRNEWRARRGEPVEVSPRRLAGRVLLETAHWMRLHTPSTAGWLDPTLVPEYGVIAPWDLGHALQYAARRPAVVDNFGDDLGPEGFELAARYFRGGEPEALEIAASRRVRYAIAAARAGFGAPLPGPASMQRALYDRDGSAGDPGGPPPLVGHRLVYESRPGEGSGRQRASLYKVFEIVPGARIRGRAAPGARVELALPVRTNRLRSFVYRASARADAGGRYVFRVPYANRGGPPAVTVAPAYRLLCGDDVADVAVAEPEVRAGGEVTGPDLCLAQ